MFPWIQGKRRVQWEAHSWQPCEACGLRISEFDEPPPPLTCEQIEAEGYEAICVTKFGDLEHSWIRGMPVA